MNILNVLKQDGFTMKRKATTGGGEYAGSCPWCGGQDRFLCWPFKKRSGLYWCRGCGRSGDAIQYLRDYRHMSFKAACDILGIISEDMMLKPRTARRRHRQPTWKPAKILPPPEIWQHRAHKIVDEGVKSLWSDKGLQARIWLQNRGLEAQTIEDQGLGMSLYSRYESHETWGLDNNGKKVWVPSGLIIPTFKNGQLLRIRIRRWDPGDGPRYFLIRGSSTTPLVIGNISSFVVVESELDAFLIYQLAGDQVSVVGLGSAQIRPDKETHKLLLQAKVILLALDSDQTGAKESWGFWKKHYSQAIRWPCPSGKDIGESFIEGLNIRLWIKAGLSEQKRIYL